jgi:hypothetical protein
MVAGDPTGSLEPPIGRIDTKARQLVAGACEGAQRRIQMPRLGEFRRGTRPHR